MSGLWMKIIVQKREGQGISPNPQSCDGALMHQMGEKNLGARGRCGSIYLRTNRYFGNGDLHFKHHIIFK
jgi:hypothetical protein